MSSVIPTAFAISFWCLVLIHSRNLPAVINQAAIAVDFGTSCWTVPVTYFVCFVLHVCLPARDVEGYACDSQHRPIRYRLNGVIVLFAALGMFACLDSTMQTAIHRHFFEHAAVACVLGVLFSLISFVYGGREEFARCVTKDQLTSDGPRAGLAVDRTHAPLLARFYLGQRWNVSVVGVDSKMYLYLIGAVMLALNILSAAAVYSQRAGSLSLAMSVYVGCFMWFIVEYLLGEEVHLYTYDLFAEKLGFKLIWGCMFFYPFFYGIGVIPLASLLPAQDISVQSATCIVVLFFSGWILTRGANLQKFMFRISGNNARFLCIRQETIVNTRILVSGFWGLSRHINYLGEIVQAIGLSLPALLAVSLPESLLSMQGLTYVYPILYPLFYIGLFIPRQADDDQLCLRKYGESWKEYQRRVPYRIVPYVW